MAMRAGRPRSQEVNPLRGREAGTGLCPHNPSVHSLCPPFIEALFFLFSRRDNNFSDAPQKELTKKHTRHILSSQYDYYLTAPDIFSSKKKLNVTSLLPVMRADLGLRWR